MNKGIIISLVVIAVLVTAIIIIVMMNKPEKAKTEVKTDPSTDPLINTGESVGVLRGDGEIVSPEEIKSYSEGDLVGNTTPLQGA